MYRYFVFSTNIFCIITLQIALLFMATSTTSAPTVAMVQSTEVSTEAHSASDTSTESSTTVKPLSTNGVQDALPSSAQTTGHTDQFQTWQTTPRAKRSLSENNDRPNYDHFRLFTAEQKCSFDDVGKQVKITKNASREDFLDKAPKYACFYHTAESIVENRVPKTLETVKLDDWHRNKHRECAMRGEDGKIVAYPDGRCVPVFYTVPVLKKCNTDPTVFIQEQERVVVSYRCERKLTNI